MRRVKYEIQATADTRSTNGAVVSASACHQGDPGSNPSGGSLGRMLTMGTDERQENCTVDGYNPERALSTDACKNDGNSILIICFCKLSQAWYLITCFKDSGFQRRKGKYNLNIEGDSHFANDKKFQLVTTV